MTLPQPVFLTGATGYLGTHVRQRLHCQDLDVTLLVRSRSSVDSLENEAIVRGDLRDPIELDSAGTVLHLAAQTSVEQAIEDPVGTWAVNATGTLRLLEAAVTANVDRFVLSSTASVYGPPDYLPIDESHPVNAIEPYGASKLAADRLLHAYHHTYGLETVTARLFNTFGTHQPAHNVVPTILEQAQDGGPIRLGNLSPSRDFLYVVDAVDALEIIIRDGSPGSVYNVGRGEETTIQEIAETAVEIIDPSMEIISEDARQRDESVEILRHVADVSKLRSLGWSPTYTIEDGLRKMI